MAVFTNGELATAIATRFADLAVTAPVTSMRTSLRAPSPSRMTCSARSSSTSSSARAKSFSIRLRALPPSPDGTRGCLACPVANNSTVSEVEVSLSTVVQLKLRSVPLRSMVCMASAGSLASVKMKHSIVAMSGAIMPEPLAKPLMRTVVSPIWAVRVAPLGKVSVVMMPRAASSHAVSSRPCCRPGNAATSFSCGSTSPMTPVEARNTCFTGQPSSLAAACAVAMQVCAPALPVNTLALPAFTTTARALPPFSAARHQSTGAPGHLLEVNTPATVVPAANSANTTSVRPW